MKILIKRTIINVYKKFNIDYKYNNKKNPRVKFIIDNEEEHKNKKKNENINKTHYY